MNYYIEYWEKPQANVAKVDGQLIVCNRLIGREFFAIFLMESNMFLVPFVITCNGNNMTQYISELALIIYIHKVHLFQQMKYLTRKYENMMEKILANCFVSNDLANFLLQSPPLEHGIHLASTTTIE